ncbi:MAG TPA: TonB-dependent receptor [Blastocatellia bacterium]|nr:TonB-dependent receptor [Blastocatellia bacterium]
MQTKIAFRITLGLLLAISSYTPTALAQNYRGAIRGRVTDPRGALIVGAQVKLIEEGTNESRALKTDGNGDFTISLLRPGSYRLEVEKEGFRKSSETLVVRVNQEARLDVTLDVAGATDPPIIIGDAASPLKYEGASLGAVIDNRQVTGLPLDGRNFLELSLLTPGAAPPAQGSAGSARGDFAFNINGSREDANNFLLDGVYNVDPKLNTFGVKPPVDAIREFEVLTSAYDAAFGRSAGAQVNIVLKSGSNGFHGTAYEFLRNQVLDARNYFAPSDQLDPRNQRNQFGFSFGGPLVKDRTFFFGDYEGSRFREGVTRLANVPTARERVGDFSQSLFDPPLIPGTQFPFPGGQIPQPFLNPIGLRIAALYPLPNRNVPGLNYASSPIQRDRNDLFDVRIDHAYSSATQLSARYSFTDRTLFEPFSGVTQVFVPGYGNNVLRRGQNLMLGGTHVFSPRLINDARVAYNRVSNQVLVENPGVSVNQQVGLPELSNDPLDFGLSFIRVTGFSPLGHEYNNPQNSATNNFQVLDTATYARGAQLLKFGFNFQYAQQNAFRDVQSRGLLTFPSQVSFRLPDGTSAVIPFITGNALANLLLGTPLVSGGARLDNHQHLRTESYNFFVNDSIRVRPQLTLSAGLRYEYNSPPVDTEDRANIYDPATRALVQVGTNGVPRAGYQSDKNNFAPRVALAWALGKENATVIRAGYGIYYDQSPLAPGEGLYFNAPFYDFRFYFQSDQAPLTILNPFPFNTPSQSAPSAFAFDRNLRTSYTQQWNLSVQRQLGDNLVAELAYVGSKGTKLLAARDINQPQASPRQPNLTPNPLFGEITQQEGSANSNYHSLQARLQQRLAFGLALLGAYTYGKSIDNASGIFSSAGDPNYPQNSFDLSAERGRSGFDVRHRFSLSYSYDLPFGKGKSLLANSGIATTLLTGWQTYGVITLQTGRPFTVALLPEFDNSNTGISSLGFLGNDRPNLIGQAKLDNPTPEQWFNTAAFAIPPFGSFGNSGRNILDGPSYKNVNFSLVKNTRIREAATIQFRTEFFNLFNHPNFGLPDNFVGSPSFGRLVSADSPRRIQFGLKLLF